jgi:hypothetical protein
VLTNRTRLRRSLHVRSRGKTSLRVDRVCKRREAGLRNRGFTTASCNYSAVRLVLQLPQLPASCETRRRFCNWASCGLVAVAQGDFATEIATAVAAQLQMSDEWITGAQISAQCPSSVYRIVYSVIKSPVALVACCVVSDCLLAGYGRLKLFRTLFRMFRTFCVSDAGFGLLCFGNYYF